MSAPLVVTSYCPGGRDCQGKFLQLVLDGVEHLVFAPSNQHGYHSQILERFLDERGIACRWDGQALRVDHPGLKVIGGGRFRLEQAKGALELWDNSQAYGRFDDAGIAEGLRAAAGPWSGLSVVIR